ncbi:cupin domain-containing protein, partial [Candidatus Aerophobetes bacterium]|nr:cupin domain-containing protein [Candidatus Aerophobetes bacterium]
KRGCIIRAGEGKAENYDWGTYLVSTAGCIDPKVFSVGQTYILPGKGHLTHSHEDMDEILFIISGKGEATVGESKGEVSAGDMIYVPAGVNHSLVNTGWEPLKLSPIKFSCKR